MASKGIYSKYLVTKVDGSPVDPAAKYFVLRYDKDQHARKALLAYSQSVKEENMRLALDILKALQEEVKP